MTGQRILFGAGDRHRLQRLFADGQHLGAVERWQALLGASWKDIGGDDLARTLKRELLDRPGPGGGDLSGRLMALGDAHRHWSWEESVDRLAQQWREAGHVLPLEHGDAPLWERLGHGVLSALRYGASQGGGLSVRQVLPGLSLGDQSWTLGLPEAQLSVQAGLLIAAHLSVGGRLITGEDALKMLLDYPAPPHDTLHQNTLGAAAIGPLEPMLQRPPGRQVQQAPAVLLDWDDAAAPVQNDPETARPRTGGRHARDTDPGSPAAGHTDPGTRLPPQTAPEPARSGVLGTLQRWLKRG